VLLKRVFDVLRAILMDRTGQALGLASTLLLVTAVAMRGLYPFDFRERIYFDYQRLQWNAEADLVLIGDSRTMIGVSPGAMTELLPELRIRNFAFGAAGYSDQYLDATETTLDRVHGARMILLGITARTLRRTSLGDNEFVRSSGTQSAYNVWKSGWGGAIQHYWRPLDRRHPSELGPGGEPGAAARWHRDGWVEPWDAQVNPAVTLRYYAELQQEGIDAAIVDRLLTRVRQWTDRGIRVYGFRPPTCDAMVAVETDFDEAAFVREFQRAGGQWLSPSGEGMTTYDGSHLDRPSALLLSHRLAELIAEKEPLIAQRVRTSDAARR